MVGRRRGRKQTTQMGAKSHYGDMNVEEQGWSLTGHLWELGMASLS